MRRKRGKGETKESVGKGVVLVLAYGGLTREGRLKQIQHGRYKVLRTTDRRVGGMKRPQNKKDARFQALFFL